ncbi:YheC/YheD family protein [Paenibacillus validus]|nr:MULTISPECIES: YheC/YheD family protein [Paenibacillus]MED4601856.1 YheC/YheD family protein [Paenibacillus validus]MED4605925.1 YheC/YheD family protein [Paenibacillus validus]
MKTVGVLAMYLSGRRLEELSFFRKLCICGAKLGLEVLVFTPDDVQGNARVNALTYKPEQGKWVRKSTAFPPLIYDRCRYHGTENYLKLSGFRKKYAELRYLSRPLGNKWKMHQLLAEQADIAAHLPATIPFKEGKEFGHFLTRYPVVYMKPKSGTGGRGIIRLQRLPGGRSYLMQGRDPSRRILPVQKVTTGQIAAKVAEWKLADQYIVQQGIPLELKDGRVHDFRMLVQKDGNGEWQVTGCVGRIGPKRSVTSNLHGGGTAAPMETLLYNRFKDSAKVNAVREEAYELGLNVVKHLENKFDVFCEVGIDLAIDPKGHVWLLEVNPKPSREVFRRIGQNGTYVKAISRPLEFALWLSEQSNDKPIE